MTRIYVLLGPPKCLGVILGTETKVYIYSY